MTKLKFPTRLARIENALVFAAELIEIRGEGYLPYFEVLEEMLEEERAKSAALGRAKELLNRTRSGTPI